MAVDSPNGPRRRRERILHRPQPPGGRRGIRRRLASLVVSVALVLALALLLPGLERGGAGKAAASTPALARLEVSVAANATTRAVAQSFFGLSTEYWALPSFEEHMKVFERVLALLHVPGDGPFVLRIGGDSADHSVWSQPRRRVPSWAFALTPRWVRNTSRLVQQTGLKLIIDLNLITGSPSRDATWVQAAERGLPRGSIEGFEIGNEPDIYSRDYWRAALGRQSATIAAALPSTISAQNYAQDFRSFASALAAVAPGVPLVGPALAEPGRDIGWVKTLLASSHPGLQTVSGHRYPFSACVSPKSSNYPTIARILSPRASSGMANSIAAVVRLAHRNGDAFRLTEMNSVMCWWPARGEQHVRDGAGRRDGRLRGDSSRGQRRQHPRPRRRDQRAVQLLHAVDPGAAAAVRDGDVRARARPGRAAGHDPLPRRSQAAGEGVGGEARRR